jgi:hypothetical protein
LLSYIDLEKRVPAKHPLRLVRMVVNEVLSRLIDISPRSGNAGRGLYPDDERSPLQYLLKVASRAGSTDASRAMMAYSGDGQRKNTRGYFSIVLPWALS